MKLHLRANEYSNSAAVHELVNGAWPLLEELSLADCIEGLAGLQCLVTSKALQMHPSVQLRLRAALCAHLVYLSAVACNCDNQLAALCVAPLCSLSVVIEAVSPLLNARWPCLVRSDF